MILTIHYTCVIILLFKQEKTSTKFFKKRNEYNF